MTLLYEQTRGVGGFRSPVAHDRAVILDPAPLATPPEGVGSSKGISNTQISSLPWAEAVRRAQPTGPAFAALHVGMRRSRLATSRATPGGRTQGAELARARYGCARCSGVVQRGERAVEEECTRGAEEECTRGAEGPGKKPELA